MNDPVIPFPVRKVPVAVAHQELAILEKTYPNAVTALEYESPFTLLIAVMLSAQTTDVRVNLITPFLFAKYPDAASLAKADLADVETLIKSSGFFRTKARNIVHAAQELVEKYGGEVPHDRDALEALPGVGRKTASVVVSVAFEGAALAVDTHVFRVSHRLGLTLGKTPREVEDDVTKLVPTEKLRHAHHWLILHGRQICKAPTPLCERCPVVKLCPGAPIVARVLRAKARAKKPRSASVPARRGAGGAATARPGQSSSAKKKR
jgi:endonuclease-3